ncbi:MAG: DUF1223 domain-containing protein [Stappia sp.]|uniref:DUF1223 domain-containing protein n=1 Tax=Stappia sp. TaxID=1870903 RepID=UPI000C4FBA25|nr:DUF1223 domain-containing protein [Stappia sp.]MAA98977.1 DUF1223 domain-containing protein [Stappia sp.]MBM18395.1 DUF1223 domain-containing protein [Stappia sp.]
MRFVSRTAVVFFLALAPSLAVAGDAPRAVVELFTSQGCSSCPPADRLMAELSRREDLVALTYPVDYWDYLGWRDTLASGSNSQRQRDYAENRGDRAVYTPQIVVNGQDHVVGSDRAALRAALERAAPLPATVRLKRVGDLVEIHVEGRLPEGTRMASVSLVAVAPPVEVAIGRGENRGRSITYVNVVRELHAVGMWEGGSATFRLPLREMRRTGATGCAAIVQEERGGRPGRVLGVGRL